MDLVILAAGMGSRFGGLKQIQQIDEAGNFIIDYSIYDALRAGFDKVIFIIKEENYQIFKETIGKRVEKRIKVEYAFQKLELLPKGYSLPTERIKPLGTAQAILAAKDFVSDKFIIINSDDFYGEDAFRVAANYLNSLPTNSKNKYANIGYKVINTMTENGSVKRGILNYNENNLLSTLIESSIEKVDNKIIATPLDTKIEAFEISKDKLVSMNMFVFTKDIMQHIEDNFPAFLDNNKNNLMKCEYLIPTLVSDLIEENVVNVEVLNTSAVWYGVTYKEDQEYVEKSLKELTDKGIYPKGLWTK